MLRSASVFLEVCEAEFPSPRKDQRHFLAFVDGSLVLTVMRGNDCQQFTLTDADLDKEPASLIEELRVLLVEDVSPETA